ncbi:MAG: hypothetical protein ACFFG0_18415 [Candidatus Thorarchaeota archaeon]
MNIKALKNFRKFSWLLALFSFLVFVIVNLRSFLETLNFYSILHITIEWILLGLLIIHCVFSRKYLKLWLTRIYRGLKSKKVRPIYALRLIQLISNRVIIVLIAISIISGFGYFEWYTNSIGIVIPFDSHAYYDTFLLIFIIIHVVVGFKFFFIRKRIKHWSSTLFLILLSSLLIFITIYMNFKP